MGYGDRDEAVVDAPAGGALALVSLALSGVVRAVGLVVLLLGLWVGVKVILEAWALYEDPSRIVRFADDIQRHSNLDGVLDDLAAGTRADAAGAAPAAAPPRASGGGLRLSYFAAWFIVLLLMFVIGSLAMAAITTGGSLALYDLTVRRHSRAVLREVQRLRRAA